MKIISWNIRGAGCGGFESQLRDLLKVHNPGIIVLIETRVNLIRVEQFQIYVIMLRYRWEDF